MSFASTPFLFLFLPIAAGIYFLLPRSRNLFFRNHFLFVVSLLCYACGEPFFILPFLLLIVFTWLLGKMADRRQNTKTGKLAVFLTVFMNAGVLLALAKLNLLLEFAGQPAGKDLSFWMTGLPIGMAFFAFHSISYVVDIYRGQCKASSRLLHAALYLSVFFKVRQGPIISYHEFEPQIEHRTTTLDDFTDGIWRFAIGFCKKMIVASNLSVMVKWVFLSDFSLLSLADAWIGCGIFLIVIYYDFSGYSDMAIGLAEIFGFKMPENFNYPYLSTSIGEYWRRWHITLCAWFRNYLFFPIVLGPSVSFRKFLLRHHVSEQTAKTMQNIFVPTCVWLVTALWHGTNWNYTIWGLANSSVMIVEPHISAIKNKRADKLIRWFCVLLFLFFTVPLINTNSLNQAMLYFKAMLAGNGIYAPSDTVCNHLKIYGFLLSFSTAGCFMVFPRLKKKLYHKFIPQFQLLWKWGEAILLFAAVMVSLGILFKTGTVTFMYEQ